MAARNKITMSDIARKSGVSLSTVSLVLNEKPGLPEDTRLKVFNAARELGYTLRSSSPVITRPTNLNTVAMLVKRAKGDSTPPSSNIFFSHVIAGIEAGCRQENISLLYSTLIVDENNNSLEIPRLIQDPRVDGLFLVGNYIDEPLNASIRRRGIPVVLVEAYCSSGEFDSIIIENEEGAYNAVSYLVEKGHRNIAYIGSFPDSRISFRYRRQGYYHALADHGIQNSYVGDCAHNDRDAIIATTRQLLLDHPEITAIIGCNDEVSMIAMHGVLDIGKRIPEDISIIGFDNNANAANSIPPLTTVDVDKISMGRLAVQLMINRADNPDQGFVTMRLHTRLIERLSVRDLRASSPA